MALFFEVRGSLLQVNYDGVVPCVLGDAFLRKCFSERVSGVAVALILSVLTAVIASKRPHRADCCREKRT
jgi:hypothetical protein